MTFQNMSCPESETKQIILERLRKEIEKKVENELDHKITALASRQCENIELLLNSLHLESIEKELYEKYNNILKSSRNYTQEILLPPYGCLDDYEAIIESIGNDKSAPFKLAALKKLLDCQVVDVSHKYWHRLAKNLQHCLISTNDEIFTSGLKMHYKIISLPASSCEGYLCLTQGLELIFNNRCFLNKQHYDANNKLQKRAVQVIKILLKTQNFVVRNLPQIKLRLFEEFVSIFFVLMCRGPECSILFEILSVLDSKANWFRCFCCSVHTRNVVLKKSINFVKVVVSVLTGQLNKVTFRNSSKRICICKQSHSMSIITEIIKYERGRKLFPIKLPSTSNCITVDQLLTTSLTKLRDPQIARTEMKQYLEHFVGNLVDYFETDSLNTLLEPINVNITDLKMISQKVESNDYIIHILNVLCERKPSKLLFRYNKHKSSKQRQLYSSSFNPLQTVTDVTVASLRHFINICELEHQVKETVIQLLHCCKNMYQVHPVSFLICNPTKLMISIKDFYEATANYNVNLHYKTDIINIASFFLINYPSGLKAMNSRTALLTEIISHTSAEALMLIPILRSDERLKNAAPKILRPYLENVWMNEDCLIEKPFEAALSRLLVVVQVIALNFKAFEAFVNCENDFTLVENERKPLTLSELVEASVGFSEDFCSSYVALLVLKVLLTNPDVALYIEAAYNLQVALVLSLLSRKFYLLIVGKLEQTAREHFQICANYHR